MQWMEAAMETVDDRPKYRFRPLEKQLCGMAMRLWMVKEMTKSKLGELDKTFSFMNDTDSRHEGWESETGSYGSRDQDGI